MKYTGITYPRLLFRLRRLWHRTCCPRGWHLFDEVVSSGHYLHCDACGLEVHIKCTILP